MVVSGHHSIDEVKASVYEFTVTDDIKKKFEVFIERINENLKLSPDSNIGKLYLNCVEKIKTKFQIGQNIDFKLERNVFTREISPMITYILEKRKNITCLETCLDPNVPPLNILDLGYCNQIVEINSNQIVEIESNGQLSLQQIYNIQWQKMINSPFLDRSTTGKYYSMRDNLEIDYSIIETNLELNDSFITSTIDELKTQVFDPSEKCQELPKEITFDNIIDASKNFLLRKPISGTSISDYYQPIALFDPQYGALAKYFGREPKGNVHFSPDHQPYRYQDILVRYEDILELSTLTWCQKDGLCTPTFFDPESMKSNSDEKKKKMLLVNWIEFILYNRTLNISKILQFSNYSFSTNKSD